MSNNNGEGKTLSKNALNECPGLKNGKIEDVCFIEDIIDYLGGIKYFDDFIKTNNIISEDGNYKIMEKCFKEVLPLHTDDKKWINKSILNIMCVEFNNAVMGSGRDEGYRVIKVCQDQYKKYSSMLNLNEKEHNIIKKAFDDYNAMKSNHDIENRIWDIWIDLVSGTWHEFSDFDEGDLDEGDLDENNKGDLDENNEVDLDKDDLYCDHEEIILI